MLLRSQLHAAQAAQKKAIENMELAKLDAEERAQSVTELQRTVQLMDQEKVAVSNHLPLVSIYESFILVGNGLREQRFRA